MRRPFLSQPIALRCGYPAVAPLEDGLGELARGVQALSQGSHGTRTPIVGAYEHGAHVLIPFPKGRNDVAFFHGGGIHVVHRRIIVERPKTKYSSTRPGDSGRTARCRAMRAAKSWAASQGLPRRAGRR